MLKPEVVFLSLKVWKKMPSISRSSQEILALCREMADLLAVVHDNPAALRADVFFDFIGMDTRSH